jgi:hypothetical protein
MREREGPSPQGWEGEGRGCSETLTRLAALGTLVAVRRAVRGNFVARNRMPPSRPHNFTFPLAGLVPAIHVFAVHSTDGKEGVDGQAEPTAVR